MGTVSQGLQPQTQDTMQVLTAAEQERRRKEAAKAAKKQQGQQQQQPAPSPPREVVAPAAATNAASDVAGQASSGAIGAAATQNLQTINQPAKTTLSTGGMQSGLTANLVTPYVEVGVGPTDIGGDFAASQEEESIKPGGGASASGGGGAGLAGGAFEPPGQGEYQEEPLGNEELDRQIRSMIGDLVSGRGMDVDTGEEEALIRELMQDRLGAGLVEQRARMGRAGFGASGALAAMEGDIRRQAGQQATQETLALRRQAEQEAIRNALESVGVDVSKRREARQEVFDEEFLNALKAALGMEVPLEGGGGGGDTSWLTTGWGDSGTLATSGDAPRGRPENAPGGLYNPIPVNAAPQGATAAGQNQQGQTIYLAQEGDELVYYVVRAQ